MTSSSAIPSAPRSAPITARSRASPATELGATVDPRDAAARGARRAAGSAAWSMGNVVQAGNRMNPARQAAIGGGVPVVGAGPDGQPRLRLRRPGHRHGRAARSGAGEHRCRGRRRHGEHGPRALPDGGRPLGLSHGAGPDPRQHADATGSTTPSRASIRAGTPRTWSARRSSPARRRTLRGALAAALRRGAEGRHVRRRDRRRSRSRAARASRPSLVDEAPRPDTTVDTLAKLRPAFRKDGTITAGNAPGLNSGAAAMIVAERALRRQPTVVEPIGPARRLWRRGGRARPVRPRPGPRRPQGAGAGRVDARRRRAHRDQRGLRRRAAGRRARSSACPRTSSMSRAAPSPTAIRSARPARC